MRFSVQINDLPHSVSVRFSIIMSKIFVYIENDFDYDIESIRNIISSAISNIIHYIGYRSVHGHSYELDSITDIKNGNTIVFGVQGFVFDAPTKWDGLCAFKAARPGESIAIDLRIVADPAMSRALLELRNAIRNPDFTALHCRLAIEAIRNGFAESETAGWALLREKLRIEKDTINSFKSAADHQRHGRNVPQSWNDRQSAMQIAWEIVHRYERYMLAGNEKPLDLPAL
jgi:hypothetical protein